ncbi:glutamate-rich WD repeat containing [Gloeopeniophorella convolvens]|nr:glutamate-rich WD repeat containing [Gloeopeniophorella convolvens]
MSKRAAGDASSAPQKASRTASGQAREKPAEDEMGEFEDAWEDEIEDEAAAERDGMEVDDEVMPPIEESDEKPQAPRTFIPGVHTLGKDEVLEPDDSVYLMRHAMHTTWPCLSFDVLRDDDGDQRQRFPASAYILAGTQADTAKNNELAVFKLTQLHKTQHAGESDDSDADDDDDDDDGALDEDAVLEHRAVPHFGGVNRVRAAPLPAGQPLPPPAQPYYAATWADTGKVHIWDVRPQLHALATPGAAVDKARAGAPRHTVAAHGRAEGFALAWAGAPGAGLRLLSGDTHAKIFLTTAAPAGFSTQGAPFGAHTASVEDLQWSPGEPTVFASCSADRSVRVWDVRSRARVDVAGVERAHASDVNVISWNRSTAYLLLSGGDEGALKVWDLRNVKKRGTAAPDPTPVASFGWHRAPITSVEWHPTEDSIFAAAGADDQVTLWDLAVEQDDEEAGGAMDETPEGARDVPPQLLFVHQGQRDVKEVHWHPQIPGAVISTALDGFNIFKTISV